LSPEVYETSSKTGSRIRILYLLTGPIICRVTCPEINDGCVVNTLHSLMAIYLGDAYFLLTTYLTCSCFT